MPKFLEKRLKEEYGADSKVPYAVMNSIGAMHGNKETPRGAAMERKHERDVKAGKASGGRTSQGSEMDAQRDALEEALGFH